MAIRNVTSQYARVRTEAIRRKGAGASLLGSGAASAGSSDAPAGYDTRPLAPTVASAPKYVDTVDEIQKMLDLAEKRMAELQKAHNDRLLAQFDDRESEKDREIDILTSSITQSMTAAGAKLKMVIGRDKSEKLDPETQVKKNITRAMARKLQSMSHEFRGMQKAYLDQLRKFKGGGAGSFSALIGEPTPKATGEDETKETDKGFSNAQLMDLMSAEELAQERDVEIRKICESIEALSVMFKELATLVIEQGTIIDRIDHNLAEAVDKTQRGLKELDKASKAQASSRPFKCMAILVVLIIILAIVLILRKA